MIYTTLEKIRAHDPCAPSWEKLLRHLGKTKADDKSLSMVEIIDVLGLDDALWCTRSLPEHGNLWRHFAVDCAERVRHLMTDKRSLDTLDVARMHAQGLATDDVLTAAWAAASAAASAAALAAAGTAALAAAGTAAWAAAWAAARNAASAAAWAAERQWQADRFRHLVTVGRWEPVQ